MNGFVERDGKKFLWIGKRSPMKQTFPGMLDNVVAGGLVRNYLSYLVCVVRLRKGKIPLFIFNI